MDGGYYHAAAAAQPERLVEEVDDLVVGPRSDEAFIDAANGKVDAGLNGEKVFRNVERIESILWRTPGASGGFSSEVAG